MSDFYFNTRTGQVEEGRQSDWQDLMGPYPTREQAQGALASAAERTERWDREDKEWNDGPVPPA